jgi:hypothetical protein
MAEIGHANEAARNGRLAAQARQDFRRRGRTKHNVESQTSKDREPRPPSTKMSARRCPSYQRRPAKAGPEPPSIGCRLFNTLTRSDFLQAMRFPHEGRSLGSRFTIISEASAELKHCDGRSNVI